MYINSEFCTTIGLIGRVRGEEGSSATVGERGSEGGGREREGEERASGGEREGEREREREREGERERERERGSGTSWIV